MAGPGQTRRRLRRVVAVVLVMAVGMTAGLAAFSQTVAFRAWLRRQVVTRVNAELAGRLQIGALTGNLFGGLVATDVRLVHEDRRVLAIRRLAATYDLLTLLRGGGLRITALAATGVSVQLIEDARGWNVDRLTAPPSSDADPDLEIDLRDVRIAHAAIRIVQPSRIWRVRGAALTGTARFAPAATEIRIDAASFTELTSGVRVAEVTGRVAGRRDADWTADGLRLRTAESELAFDGRWGADVDGHLRVTRLAASEVRALLRADVPRSDWQGELRAAGPRAAVAVTGVLEAQGLADGATRSGGRTRLAGTLDVRTATPVGALRAELERVDLAVIVGRDVPATDLSGTLDLATRADEPRVFRVGVDLREPRLGPTTLAALTGTGRVTEDEVAFEVDAVTRSGTAHAAGTLAPSTERFDVRVTATEMDLGALTGRTELVGRMNAVATLTGAGFAPATAAAAAGLEVAPSRIGNVAISAGAMQLRVAGGRVVVERATVATSAGTADASGELALGPAASPPTGGLRGEVRATDLRPLATLLGRPEIGGTATLKVNAQGHAAALDGTAELAGRGLVGTGWHAASVAGTLTGRALGSAAASVELKATARDLVLDDRRLNEVSLTGSWRGSLTTARADVDLHAREATAQHELRAEIARAADATRVTVTRLRLEHRDTSWMVVGTPVVELRDERVTIDDFTLRSPRGSARLRGGVGGMRESDLELLVDGLELDALTDLVPDEVHGRLVGRAHLGGSLVAPRLDADLGIASPMLGGTRYDDLRARIAAGGGRVEVHGSLAKDAQTLIVDGTAPLQWSLAPVRYVVGDPTGRVRAAGIDLAFVGAFWPGLVTKAGGTITGDVTLGGSLDAPEARGTIALAGGRGYVVPLGVTWDPVAIALRLDGRVASIEHLVIESGKGRLVGGGDARLGNDGATMDARFESQRFPLFANEYGHGAASGWLWISGTMAAPVLEGSLETDGLVLQIPEVLPTAIRPPDPTIVVIGPGAPPPPPASKAEAPPAAVPGLFERAAVTVQLAVPRDAWVRRSDANIELQGWMTAWKKPSEELHLAGDIRGVRGWYAFQGKKFTLAEGSVRFSGQDLDPVLDITATHPAGDYLVRLRVEGTVTKPSLRLESEPALEQADVLAVLLFGAPASQLNRSQSAGLREQALGIAGGYVASELRQSVANALGVDDLQFDTGTTGLQDARVSVGKYVADDIFVSLAHRFGQSVEEVRIEYVIRPEWSLETSTDTLGRSGVDLFWKRRY